MILWHISRGTHHPVTVLMHGDQQVCDLSNIIDPQKLDDMIEAMNTIEEFLETMQKKLGGESCISTSPKTS